VSRVKLVSTVMIGLALLPARAALRAEVGAQENDAYVSEEFGFQIERPGAGWTCVPQHKAPGAVPGED
jgi:hypothetical protein